MLSEIVVTLSPTEMFTSSTQNIYAHKMLTCTHSCTGKAQRLIRYPLLTSPLWAAQWTKPNSKVWGVCQFLLSLIPVSLFFLTHSSTCSHRVALVTSPLQWTKAQGKRRKGGRDRGTNESCPDWWERRPKTPSGEKRLEHFTPLKFLTFSPLRCFHWFLFTRLFSLPFLFFFPQQL